MNPYFKPLDYKLLSQKTVYKGKRITVEELEYYNPRDDKQVHREHVLAGMLLLSSLLQKRMK